MLQVLKYLILQLCLLEAFYSGVVLGQNFVIGPKIINGQNAERETNKYQVSIHLKERDIFFGSGHICGGSLISESIVLTAAHCIYNAQSDVFRSSNELIVSMGTVDRFDRVNSTSFEILEIYYKDTFNISTFVDDVAILYLNGFVPTRYTNIQPIEINWNSIPDDSLCKVSGWGTTEDGITSDILKTLDVPIVNKDICAKKYDGAVREGMICAGYMNGSADACDGDSGGPLVCNGGLTGVVSFGVGCAVVDFPGIYTNLSYHSEWIQNVTKQIGKLRNSVMSTAPTYSLFVIILLALTIREFSL